LLPTVRNSVEWEVLGALAWLPFAMLRPQVNLHLFKLTRDYLITPAGKPLPEEFADSLLGRIPDMIFQSSVFAVPSYIEEQVRINGAAVVDQEVGDLLFGSYPGWIANNL